MIPNGALLVFFIAKQVGIQNKVLHPRSVAIDVCLSVHDVASRLNFDIGIIKAHQFAGNRSLSISSQIVIAET